MVQRSSKAQQFLGGWVQMWTHKAAWLPKTCATLPPRPWLVLYLQTGTESIKAKQNQKQKWEGSREKRSARKPASGPAFHKTWEAGSSCYGDLPPFPSTPQGQGPQQLCSANTWKSQLCTKLKAPTVSIQKKRGNGAQVDRSPFLWSYHLPTLPQNSFLPPLVTKTVNVLLLAQHSEWSHKDPRFNTKIKCCVSWGNSHTSPTKSIHFKLQIWEDSTQVPQFFFNSQ